MGFMSRGVNGVPAVVMGVEALEFSSRGEDLLTGQLIAVSFSRWLD